MPFALTPNTAPQTVTEKWPCCDLIETSDLWVLGTPGVNFCPFCGSRIVPDREAPEDRPLLVARACQYIAESPSPWFRETKEATAFRELAERAEIVDLPEGAFRESGTAIRTKMLVLDKEAA